MGCHFLLQEIFPTQGLNLGLPHCRQTLYHLSHQGSPMCSNKHHCVLWPSTMKCWILSGKSLVWNRTQVVEKGPRNSVKLCFQNSPCAPQMFLSWGLGREHYLFGYRVITMENKHNSGPGFQIIQMYNIWNSPFNFNQSMSGRLALILHFPLHPSPLPWYTGGRLYFSVSWPSHVICFSLWKEAEVIQCQS